MRVPSSSDRVLLAIVGAAATAIGCGPPDVSGDWRGTWRVEWGLGEGEITMSLTQTDDRVSGSYDVDGSLCAEQGDVEGTVDRDSIRLELVADGGGRVDIHGTVSGTGDRIDGDFDVSEGWCGAGAEGDVELHRE